MGRLSDVGRMTMRKAILLTLMISGVAMGQSTIRPPLTISDSSTRSPMNVTARSAAPTTPATGEIYLDDGTNRDDKAVGFRRYDGSAWQDLGRGTAINVKDYGATGDGSTDDTAAIQAAWVAAKAADTPLYFPAGTYIVDCSAAALFTLADSDPPIIAAGHRVTRLSVTDAAGVPVIDVQGDDCVIAGLRIYGTSTLGTGIRAGTYASTAVTRLLVDDVVVGDMGIGLDHQYGWINTFRRMQFNSCAQAYYQLLGNSLHFEHLSIEGGTDGIDIDGGNSVSFVAACIEGLTGTAIEVDAAHGVSFDKQSYLEYIDTYYFNVGSASRVWGFSFEGTIWGQADDGDFAFDDVEGLKFDPNSMTPFIRDRIAQNLSDTASTKYVNPITVDRDGILGGTKDLVIGCSIPDPNYWWTLNDNAASTAVVDAMGSQNLTAAANTSTKTAYGKVSTALEFNGTTDYLANAAATVGGTLGSIACWFRVDALNSSYQTIWSSYDEDDSDNAMYLVVTNAGVLRFSQNENGTATVLVGGTTLSAERYYHVAVVSSGSAVAIYLDGVAESLTVSSGANDGDWFLETPDRDNFEIGRRYYTGISNYWYFDGRIDDVRVYDVALTQAQAQYLYDHPGDNERRNLTVSGAITANSGLAVKNGAISAGYIDIYEDSDDGTNKVRLQAGTLGADVTVTLPQMQFYNVKAYGAVGDGVTDDTEAVQAAIDAADTAGGGTVYFPWTDDYYSLDGNLDLDACENITFRGDSKVRIHRTGQDPNGAIFYSVDSTVSKVRFENLRLTMAATYQCENSQTAIRLIGENASDVTDVQVANCAFDTVSKAIYVGNAERVVVRDCTFTNCLQISTNTNGYGVQIERVYDAKIVNNHFAATVMRHAVYTQLDARDVLIQGNTIFGNTDANYMPTGYERPLKIMNIDNCDIVGNTVTNGLSTIVVDGNVNNLTVVGNVFNDTEGILWVAGDAVAATMLISGNHAVCSGVDADTGVIYHGSTSDASVVLTGNDFRADDNIIRGNCTLGITAVGNRFEYTGVLNRWVIRTAVGTPVTLTGNYMEGYYRVTRNGIVSMTGNYLVDCDDLTQDAGAGSVVRGNYPDTQDVFNAGLAVKNGATSAGYVDLYPDNDLGDSTAFVRETIAIVDLTNAQIKDLSDTPVELVPAPGAGKWLELCGASLWLDYGTNGLTEADSPDDLCIEYDSGTGPAASASIVASGFITATADTGAFAISVSLAGTAAASIVNKNLALVNTGADYTGNAGNDTVMRVIVRYRVHSGLGL